MKSIDNEGNDLKLTKINSQASLSGQLIYNYQEGVENIFHNKEAIINNI